MKYITAVLTTALLLQPVFATQIVPTQLRELVGEAEYIVIGKIVKVDMVDAEGTQITELKARTGPGLTNTIRYHARTHRTKVIKGDASVIPLNLLLPEWQRWHNSLGIRKQELEGHSFIFFLNSQFKPSKAAEFMHDLSKEKEIRGFVH